jgi:hypothetical protein
VEALGDGVTSYNFNMPGVARAMYEHIITWSPSKARRATNPIVEVPGVLVERTSSGRPGTGRRRM